MDARCLIVDDESPARDELRYLLGRVEGVVVVGEATTAEEALVLIGSLDYDVVLLDIRMPGMGGLGLAEALAAVDGPTPAVILTTAYPDHAVEAFDLGTADYLVKPIEEDRLRRALQRALERRSAGRDRAGDVAGGGGDERPRTEPAVAPPGAPSRIPVHRGGRVILVDEPRIAYAEAARGYVHLKLADEKLLASFTLNELEERLSDAFVRTHRSFLVNMRHVREVIPEVGGSLTLLMGDKDRSRVPVSRRQASEVRRRLGV